MKRFTGMFLAVCMLALLVSGCQPSSGSDVSNSSGTITLTYWDGWADAGTEPTGGRRNVCA